MPNMIMHGDVNEFRRDLRAVLQAVMRQPIEKHVIGRADKAAKHTVARAPASRIKQDMFVAQNFADAPLQLARISCIPH